MKEFEILLKASQETIYMASVSIVFIAIIGLILGICTYITGKDSIMPNRIINLILNTIINIFRSIPFVILLIVLLPVTNLITGTIIGSKAFIPPLIIAASPFYGRIVDNAFKEVDSGVIEAAKAMGASNIDIIIKVLIKESLPALVNGLTLTAVSIVGYTAMAGLIGGGGLGEVANRYGVVKNRMDIVYMVVLISLVIVITIQIIGDLTAKKIDKR